METHVTKKSSLSELDQQYIWHPFTQMKTTRPSIPIIRAEGVYLYSEDGLRYIDAISSWWVNLHGHAHPYIAERINQQTQTLDHVLFAGFTHAPAVDLAKRLISILPGKMSKIFYSDNGSTSVEIAIKMAIQYWKNKDCGSNRSKIVCFKKSYHGDTFGAMSAAGKNEFNQHFWKQLFEVESIDAPTKGNEETSINQLQKILEKGEIAAFIFEPLILGSGGMIIYPPEGLNKLIQLCKQYRVLTIADEVMTGFGRTQTLFACEQLRFTPDIICLSKGLTGGFLPLGVTASTEKIYEAFLGDTLKQAFLHGHSYTANPIACSSALASLDLLQNIACYQQREFISRAHKDFCLSWKNHPKIKRCESIGTILAIEYRSDCADSYLEASKTHLYHFFLDNGVLIRPLGNVLYILPPYCIQLNELQLIYELIIFTLEGTKVTT